MSRYQNSAVPLSVSQNFLTSRSTINRLLRLTDITSADTVLEIGADAAISRAHFWTAAAASERWSLTARFTNGWPRC